MIGLGDLTKPIERGVDALERIAKALEKAAKLLERLVEDPE